MGLAIHWRVMLSLLFIFCSGTCATKVSLLVKFLFLSIAFLFQIFISTFICGVVHNNVKNLDPAKGEVSFLFVVLVLCLKVLSQVFSQGQVSFFSVRNYCLGLHLSLWITNFSLHLWAFFVRGRFGVHSRSNSIYWGLFKERCESFCYLWVQRKLWTRVGTRLILNLGRQVQGKFYIS